MEPIKENRFLSLNSLSKNYGEQKVLSALSYSFYPKGLYLLLGENGSGKSTLLNILSGKDTDYEGKVFYSGEELTEKDREKAKKILTDLGLGDVLEEKCKELSEGEKERLCFGQALYADKEIILLDEITANLDPISTERILKNILALSKGRLVVQSG